MVEHFYGDKEIKRDSTLESPLIVIFYVLKNFYGSFSMLRSKIEYLKNHLSQYHFHSSNIWYRNDNLNVNKKLITFCLPFLLPEKLLSEDIGSENRTCFIQKYNCTLHYNGLFNSSYINFDFIKASEGDDPKSKEFILSPYEILLDSFDTCNKLGALV
jgi:hypothetical protein